LHFADVDAEFERGRTGQRVDFPVEELLLRVAAVSASNWAVCSWMFIQIGSTLV
jgi:hypothetical protein